MNKSIANELLRIAETISGKLTSEQIQAITKDLEGLDNPKIRDVRFDFGMTSDIRKGLKDNKIAFCFYMTVVDGAKYRDSWEKDKSVVEKEFKKMHIPDLQIGKLNKILNGYLDDWLKVGDAKLDNIEGIDGGDYKFKPEIKVNMYFPIKVIGAVNEVQKTKAQFAKGNVLKHDGKFYAVIEVVWNDDDFEWNYIIQPIGIDGSVSGEKEKYFDLFEKAELYERSVSSFVKKFSALKSELSKFTDELPVLVDKMIKFTKDNSEDKTVEKDVNKGKYDVAYSVGVRFHVVKFSADLSKMLIKITDVMELSGDDVFKFNADDAKNKIVEYWKKEMPHLTESYGGAELRDAGNFKKIVDYVDAMKTWYDKEVSSSHILLQTRDNGNVGAEEAGKKDIDEANRIIKELKSKFPNEIKIEAEVVDEWVHINIKPKV